jgi:DDE superfamily endonuclease
MEKLECLQDYAPKSNNLTVTEYQVIVEHIISLDSRGSPPESWCCWRYGPQHLRGAIGQYLSSKGVENYCLRNKSWRMDIAFLITFGRKHLTTGFSNDNSRNWSLNFGKNGWITSELGLRWLYQFQEHTVVKKRSTNRLLIIGSHESQNSLEFLWVAS